MGQALALATTVDPSEQAVEYSACTDFKKMGYAFPLKAFNHLGKTD